MQCHPVLQIQALVSDTSLVSDPSLSLKCKVVVKLFYVVLHNISFTYYLRS